MRIFSWWPSFNFTRVSDGKFTDNFKQPRLRIILWGSLALNFGSSFFFFGGSAIARADRGTFLSATTTGLGGGTDLLRNREMVGFSGSQGILSSGIYKGLVVRGCFFNEYLHFGDTLGRAGQALRFSGWAPVGGSQGLVDVQVFEFWQFGVVNGDAV